MPRHSRATAQKIALLGGELGLSHAQVKNRFHHGERRPSTKGIQAVLKRWANGAEGEELRGRSRSRPVFSPEVIATIKSEIELEPRRYSEELAEIVATKHRMKRPSRSKVRKCLLHDLGLTRKKIQ